MASLLYVFPHPDDESFGPAPALARQRRAGHEVHLLTLTRGEATSQRERLGVSNDEMGRIRYEEMQNVARELDLTSLTVLDYPDGGLDDLDPRRLEATIVEHVHRTTPDVMVTYPVHGISGHPDHIVTHAVVKRAACALRAHGEAVPRRLAFFALSRRVAADRPDHLTVSPDEKIDVYEAFDPKDLEQAHTALYRYETYRPVIEKHRPLEGLSGVVPFECFGESHRPRLDDITTHLPDVAWWSSIS